MKLYNTLSREVEEFKPIRLGKVGLYSCGPTVYNFAHIGNLRTFVFEDILRRTLEADGLDVYQVKNLTDVDDKTIRDSKKDRISLKDFTERFTVEFFQDVDALNIKRAQIYPKATEHIGEMIEMIKCLLEKEIAYISEDGVYFSINKMENYGALAHLDLKGLKAGASGRVLADEYEKENVGDFALWKFWTEADGDVKWPAPFGQGRPGWHIECSAMSAKYLGVPFDIHTGGIDLLFPHHEDEVAQTKGCTGELLAHYWLHAEHLLVDGKKMSKSAGNFYTLRDILERQIDPLVLRYFFLCAHYRSKLNFTWEALQGAQNALQKLRERARDLESPAIGCAGYEMDFREALNNDLNTPQALAVMWQLLADDDMPDVGKAQSLLYFDRVLGLGLEGYVGKQLEIPADVQKLVDERTGARAAKDWIRSDDLRAKILALGYEVDDTIEGIKIKKNA